MGGHIECIRAFLEHGASLDAVNWRGGIPRCQTNHRIISWKGSLFLAETALHIACKFGYDNLVSFLLEQADDSKDLVNKIDLHLQTPIHHAARNGHIDCIEELLNVDSRLAGAQFS